MYWLTRYMSEISKSSIEKALKTPMSMLNWGANAASRQCQFDLISNEAIWKCACNWSFAAKRININFRIEYFIDEPHSFIHETDGERVSLFIALREASTKGAKQPIAIIFLNERGMCSNMVNRYIVWLLLLLLLDFVFLRFLQSYRHCVPHIGRMNAWANYNLFYAFV